MSFSLQNNSLNPHFNMNLNIPAPPAQQVLPDMRLSYKTVAEDFCRQYYNMYDTNFGQLASYYTQDAIFTFLDEELVGFNKLYERISQYNIYRFTHHTINVNSQAVGLYGLMVTVTGKVSVNDSIFQQNYVETIILQMDEYGTLFVTNSTFKLFE